MEQVSPEDSKIALAYLKTMKHLLSSFVPSSFFLILITPWNIFFLNEDDPTSKLIKICYKMKFLFLYFLKALNFYIKIQKIIFDPAEKSLKSIVKSVFNYKKSSVPASKHLAEYEILYWSIKMYSIQHGPWTTAGWLFGPF